MRNIFILLLLFVTTVCNATATEFLIKVYNNKNKLVTQIKESDLISVDWQKQRYELKPGHKLKQEVLVFGKMEFRFGSELLFTAAIFPFGSSDLRPGITVISTGTILGEKDLFHVSFPGEDVPVVKLLSNKEVIDYLRSKKLLIEPSEAFGLTPVLAALQVKHLDTMINFYTKHFGLHVSERKNYPEYHLEIAFLENKQFELELAENKKADKTITTDSTGLVKIAFEVYDVRRLYNYLKSENVPIIVPLRESERTGYYLTFIIADPEKNWIQFKGAAAH